MRINLKDDLNIKLINEHLLYSTFWLLVYASSSTLIVSAISIFALWNFSPEVYELFEFGMDRRKINWINSILIDPFIESVILSFVAIFFEKIIKNGGSIIASALTMSILHFFQSFFLVLTVFTFFLFQSYAFNYLHKINFRRAFLVISISHALHNLWIILLLKLIFNN